MFIVLARIDYEGTEIVRVFNELKDAVNYARSSAGNLDCNSIEVVEWQEGWKKGKDIYIISK